MDIGLSAFQSAVRGAGIAHFNAPVDHRWRL